jgi:hypothetical protein
MICVIFRYVHPRGAPRLSLSAQVPDRRGEPRESHVSDQSQATPITTLRQSFEQARALPPNQQIDECVDQLGHPELIMAELVDAFHTVESWLDANPAPREDDLTCDREKQRIQSEEYIYEGRDLFVTGEPCAFTCLSTNVSPLPGAESPEPGISSGLDYVGLTCDQTATPVLGAVQSPGDATAYPLLLRGLACLSEMAPRAQAEQLSRRFFKGALSDQPVFDLNIVVWDLNEAEEPEHTPIRQFTRDLSETVKKALMERDELPRILRHIVCLRMNHERFDGRLRFDWRV